MKYEYGTRTLVNWLVNATTKELRINDIDTLLRQKLRIIVCRSFFPFYREGKKTDVGTLISRRESKIILCFSDLLVF